jgi:hypothetical protein
MKNANPDIPNFHFAFHNDVLLCFHAFRVNREPETNLKRKNLFFGRIQEREETIRPTGGERIPAIIPETDVRGKGFAGSEYGG